MLTREQKEYETMDLSVQIIDLSDTP